MNGTVLDILIYVFDHYMFDETPEVPEREQLAQDLANIGFGEANVERALDWLADLAGERHRAEMYGTSGETPISITALQPLRIYSEAEQAHLPTDCRGVLLSLELAGILLPAQREIVIDRLLALDAEDLSMEQVHWVALMVLSSQPGQELACAHMEMLVFDADETARH
jgi:Smg protein